jgi:hypothetical protein
MGVPCEGWGAHRCRATGYGFCSRHGKGQTQLLSPHSAPGEENGGGGGLLL